MMSISQQHKLLKSDMEAVKKLKKEPYDDFSLG